MNNEYTNGYLTEASVRHLCLCSGYDGVGRGLKRVFPNLRTVAYVEREGFPIANLVASAEENQMDAAPIFTDVKTFPYDKFRGCVDILSAGFPCQPFSSAGKRQSTDDERHLYPWIADGITACRPRLVLLENVDGIVTAKTADGESVLRYVLRDLEERGYTCSWCVASASEVGASHQRKRVFIMGYASSVGSCRWSADESRQRSEVLGSRSESDAEMGHSQHSGLYASQDGRSVGSEQEEGRMQEPSGRRCEPCVQFPARPNERQHEWEEPRTVGDPASGGSQRDELSEQSRQQTEVLGTGHDETRLNAEIEPELGGATDGRPCRVNPTANRTDRLRLLGNGVVPATCERAVRILWNELWIS